MVGKVNFYEGPWADLTGWRIRYLRYLDILDCDYDIRAESERLDLSEWLIAEIRIIANRFLNSVKFTESQRQWIMNLDRINGMTWVLFNARFDRRILPDDFYAECRRLRGEDIEMVRTPKGTLRVRG